LLGRKPVDLRGGAVIVPQQYSPLRHNHSALTVLFIASDTTVNPSCRVHVKKSMCMSFVELDQYSQQGNEGYTMVKGYDHELDLD
jgi:hypothetical protein